MRKSKKEFIERQIKATKEVKEFMKDYEFKLDWENMIADRIENNFPKTNFRTKSDIFKQILDSSK